MLGLQHLSQNQIAMGKFPDYACNSTHFLPSDSLVKQANIGTFSGKNRMKKG
jgi:hypothetical protein